MSRPRANLPSRHANGANPEKAATLSVPGMRVERVLAEMGKCVEIEEVAVGWLPASYAGWTVRMDGREFHSATTAERQGTFWTSKADQRSGEIR